MERLDVATIGITCIGALLLFDKIARNLLQLTDGRLVGFAQKLVLTLQFAKNNAMASVRSKYRVAEQT